MNLVNLPEEKTKLLIDKVASKVVSSHKGTEIESLMKLKQLSNPQFSFLKIGGPNNAYYEWKKQSLLQQNSLQTMQTIQPLKQIPLQSQQQNVSRQMGMVHNPMLIVNRQARNIAMMPIGPNPMYYQPQQQVILPRGEKYLSPMEVQYLDKLLVTLDGSQECIKQSCKWILDRSNINKRDILNRIYLFIRNISPAQFTKKLFILYVINDLLHKVTTTNNNVTAIKHLNPLAQEIYLCLENILPLCYNGYNDEQKLKIDELLDLWQNRKIFGVDMINKLKNNLNISNNNKKNKLDLITQKLNLHLQQQNDKNENKDSNNKNINDNNNNHSRIVWPSPLLNYNLQSHYQTRNSLKVDVGLVKEIALDLRRHGGGGTYVPIPLDRFLSGVKALDLKYDINNTNSKVNMEISNNIIEDKSKLLLKKWKEFERELELIDPERIDLNSNSNKNNRKSKNDKNIKNDRSDRSDRGDRDRDKLKDKCGKRRDRSRSRSRSRSRHRDRNDRNDRRRDRDYRDRDRRR